MYYGNIIMYFYYCNKIIVGSKLFYLIYKCHLYSVNLLMVYTILL